MSETPAIVNIKPANDTAAAGQNKLNLSSVNADNTDNTGLSGSEGNLPVSFKATLGQASEQTSKPTSTGEQIETEIVEDTKSGKELPALQAKIDHSPIATFLLDSVNNPDLDDTVAAVVDSAENTGVNTINLLPLHSDSHVPNPVTSMANSSRISLSDPRKQISAANDTSQNPDIDRESLKALQSNTAATIKSDAELVQTSAERITPAYIKILNREYSADIKSRISEQHILKDAQLPAIDHAKLTKKGMFEMLLSRQSVVPVGQPTATSLLESQASTTLSSTTNSLINPSLISNGITSTSGSTGFGAALSAHTAVTEAFGQPQWGAGLSKQIVYLANQNIRAAEIRMNPAHLGLVEVRIDVKDDQVNVSFGSHHAVVRDAVEQSIPKLREMFEQSGLNLNDTDVLHQSFSEQREQAMMQAGVSGDNDPSPHDDTFLDSTEEITTDIVNVDGLVTKHTTGVDLYI